MHSRSGEPCENEPPRAYALIQPPIFGRRADATLGDNCSGHEEKKIDDFPSPPPGQPEREREKGKRLSHYSRQLSVDVRVPLLFVILFIYLFFLIKENKFWKRREMENLRLKEY